jgi:hypothetical protein
LGHGDAIGVMEFGVSLVDVFNLVLGKFEPQGRHGEKPELDEATIEIARRMLSAPPKPHNEMKVKKPVRKVRKKRATKTVR